ncbi:MAG: phosphatase PAP2 family protein [Alphaproteobacteria bacterium]
MRWLADLDGRAIAALAAATAAAAAVFAAFPAIDVIGATLFHDVAGFALSGTWIDKLYDGVLRGATVWAALAAVPLWLAGELRGRAVLGFGRRAFAFVLTALVLACIIVPDVLFKPVFGRARPFETLPFGGDLPVTGPFRVAGACTDNCSFYSGDVAFAVSLIVFVLLLPAGRRLPWLVLWAIWSLFVAIMRMGVGKHFPSDVLFAALISLLVVLIVRHAVARCRWGWLDGPGRRTTVTHPV